MDVLEHEAKTVYAEYRKIREEYSVLDKGNPLHKNRRVQLKEKYSELNKRYADLMMGLREARRYAKGEMGTSDPAPRQESRAKILVPSAKSTPAYETKPSVSGGWPAQQRRTPSASSRKAGIKPSTPGEGEVTLRVVAVGGGAMICTGTALAISFFTGYGRETVTGLFETINLRMIAEGNFGYFAAGGFVALGVALIGASFAARRLLRLMAPIHACARRGQTDKLKRVLALGVDVDLRDKRGHTPLHCAVISGHEDAAMLLLESGADMEALNERGESALFTAASNRDLPVLRLLLDYGANVHSKNENGSTLTHIAASEGDSDLIKLAMDYKLDREATTKAGYTPLHFAAQNGHLEVLEYLLASGVNPDPNSPSGPTPMCAAARSGHDAIIRALIEAGASVNAREGFDNAGPLAVALESKQQGVAELLRQHGAVAVRSISAA